MCIEVGAVFWQEVTDFRVWSVRALHYHVKGRMNIPGIVPAVMLLQFCLPEVAPAQTPKEFAGITEWGTWLYRYDVASWMATDTVVALHPDTSELGSYVAFQIGTNWVVSFGHLSENALSISYSVTVDSAARIVAVSHRLPAVHDTAMWFHAARALRSGAARFRARRLAYNGMVFPQEDGTWSVYFVPAEVPGDSVLIGGDARYTISTNGLTVLDSLALHKSILAIKRPRAHSDLQAMMHSHILVDRPVETDVFYVLRQRPRIRHYIDAGNRLYSIETDGTIRVVSDK